MRFCIWPVTLGLVVATTCLAQALTIEKASALETQGKFNEAGRALTNALANTNLSNADRKQLEFELDRLERIRKDFTLTKDALFDLVKQSVKDVTAEEFDHWIAEGYFDSREIDGEQRFMRSSARNLFYLHPELNSRRIVSKDRAPHEKAVLAACQAIADAARKEKKPYVLPKRFRVAMTVTVKSGIVPNGEIVRAWLPIPREYPFRKDFEVNLDASNAKELNDGNSPIRAAYFEQSVRPGKPTRFKIEYDYTMHGVHFELNPQQVETLSPPLGNKMSDKEVRRMDAEFKKFTSETSHVMFTGEMRELSEKIAGSESNPLLKARAFYDWISENIKYSFAIEYSTIRNISEYCRTRRYGDCGQEALLFITLCRLNGIPARWQSGWNTFPDDEDIHDWTEIYLAPYGWMPVDPYMGIWAMQIARTLTPEQKQFVRDFYFGGLDQWRMIANSDHCQELTPPKNTFRSDNVDFQRGELEWDNHNLYFDKFSYELKVKEVKLN